MKAHSLDTLERLGQSIWLDYIQRDLIASGKLHRLIEEEGVTGMTSNPAIFEKAIVDSSDYNADIQSMARQGMDAKAVYEALTQHDVRAAADEFRPLYKTTKARDGYVSLEVNPHLAHDTEGTIQEARRLWAALDRPNVLIKVPATLEGLPAIKQLISEGINVNVTLLFGLPRYAQVVEMYLAGMEARLAAGHSVDHIASVASFFVSRIDVLVDPLLTKIAHKKGSHAASASVMLGQVAVASARGAYQIYKQTTADERFTKLAHKGVMPQRLLWASTGVKNPEYSDVKYMQALIGPNTVNTVPPETLDAFRDHGEAKALLDYDIPLSTWILAQLPGMGIDIDAVTQKLEAEGVQKFRAPFDKLMKTLKQRSKSAATKVTS